MFCWKEQKRYTSLGTLSPISPAVQPIAWSVLTLSTFSPSPCHVEIMELNLNIIIIVFCCLQPSLTFKNRASYIYRTGVLYIGRACRYPPGVAFYIFFSTNVSNEYFNPLKPELNPICYLLALLAHHFLHVSRIRVKSLTLRWLMSYIYIYGAPILDVSRSHTTTQHSR